MIRPDTTATAPTAQSVSRAIRFCVDTDSLTPTQRALFAQHGGGARQIYNWALAIHNERADWLRDQAATAAAGDPLRSVELLKDSRWRKNTLATAPDRIRDVSKAALSRRFTLEKADPESPLHWWTEGRVNRFAMSSALDNLDAALKRFYNDTNGCRTRPRRRPRKDGRPHGWPRFKRRHDNADSFALFNLVMAGQSPWRVVDAGHRIKIPTLGTVRVHQNTKRLRRMIGRGGIVKSARCTSRGSRWYLTLVVSMPAPPPAEPTKAQRAAGTVGVDVGVKALGVLSTGETVPNPRHARLAEKRVARLQQQLARRRRPRGQAQSAAYIATRRRLADAQHQVALHRASTLHQLTKRLATGWATVAIEDLNVAGMTASPAPSADPDHPDRWLPNGAAAKAGLSRSILDVGFGEFRRQLGYKTSWYGATLAVVDRFAPTSKTCSACGAVKAKLALSERTYRCDTCGLKLDRDHNAALNIAALAATSPPDGGDAKRPAKKRANPPPQVDSEARKRLPIQYSQVS